MNTCARPYKRVGSTCVFVRNTDTEQGVATPVVRSHTYRSASLSGRCKTLGYFVLLNCDAWNGRFREWVGSDSTVATSRAKSYFFFFLICVFARKLRSSWRHLVEENRSIRWVDMLFTNIASFTRARCGYCVHAMPIAAPPRRPDWRQSRDPGKSGRKRNQNKLLVSL